jgi:Flp pilus assembly protein TadG
MINLIQRLLGDRRGTLMVELGMALPVLTLLTLGGLEVGRYVLLHQKMDRVAGTVGDLVAQAETLTIAGLDGLFDAASHVAKPFDLPADGVVVVSSVGSDAGGNPVVNWQRSGGGTLGTAVSRVGSAGGAATLPTGFSLGEGDTAIVRRCSTPISPGFWAA